jgi:hypothetical protein
LALLTVVTLSGAVTVSAQSQTAWSSNGWVSSGTLYDLTGNANLASGQPLIAGHSYNLTITVVVPNTSISTKTFAVSLNPLFEASTEPVFWTVHNPSYPGYNQTSFVGGDKAVSLNYDQGTVKLSGYFKVPGNFTMPVAKYATYGENGSITLHIPLYNVILASVVPASSTGTGSFSASIEDQDIETYQAAYNQTSNLVPSGKIPSSYSGLVNSLIGEAQALDKLGLPDNGTSLLNVIVPSAFPSPPNSSLQTDLLGGLIGAVIVIVLLAVVMVRSRGKSGYSSVIINDVQKDLAVLEVTAAKYDRAMADKLKALRDKLSESS